MKQRLGARKRRRIERLTGKKVRSAYTRGGWPHFWAEVFFEGETYTLENMPPMVNYRTGETGGGHPFGRMARVIARETARDAEVT